MSKPWLKWSRPKLKTPQDVVEMMNLRLAVLQKIQAEPDDQKRAQLMELYRKGEMVVGEITHSRLATYADWTLGAAINAAKSKIIAIFNHRGDSK